MKLSTSQVPTNLGSKAVPVPLLPESTLGGFGPTDPDGYGLLYVGVGDNLCESLCSLRENCTLVELNILLLLGTNEHQLH